MKKILENSSRARTSSLFGIRPTTLEIRSVLGRQSFSFSFKTINYCGLARQLVFLAVLLAAILLTALPYSAKAGPGSCVESGGVVTCTGDHSDGILSGVDFTSPPTTTLNVNTLTNQIQPASGTPGI